jgi:hypothetical protein
MASRRCVLAVGEPVQVFAVDADRYRLLDQRLVLLAWGPING